MSNQPPPHKELLSLPPTLENTDAKLNHLITRFEVGFVGVELLADEARASRLAAEKAADIALRVSQRAEPLTKAQRFAAVAVGGLMGGAVMGSFISMLMRALHIG